MDASVAYVAGSQAPPAVPAVEGQKESKKGTKPSPVVLVILGVLVIMGLGGIVTWQVVARHRSHQARAQERVVEGAPKAEEKAQEVCQAGGGCATQKDCRGIECAASSEQCFSSRCFAGIRPSENAVMVKLTNPSKIVFSYPFQGCRLRTSSGSYISADMNSLRTVAGSRHPCEYWDFDGRYLVNRETGMGIRKLNDYEVTLDQLAGTEEEQWLFDGQRFYSLKDAVRQGKFQRLAFNDKFQLPFLELGSARDLYLNGAHSLVVEGFTPPYSY